MIDYALLPIAVRELPNGAIFYHIKNNSELTRIEAVMRTGSIHEQADAGCGLSHFLEHMLFQGCKGFPGNSGADRIHALGGDCNAYTTFDHTAYYAEVPWEKFPEAAEVICSMISAPDFPEEKFLSEKEVIAREADMIFDRPNHVLIQQLWQGLFAHHPARLPIIGFPDKIATVTRDTMLNYYQRRYGAMRCHFLITGKLDTDMIQGVLAGYLADFKRGNLEEPVLPQEPESLFETRSVNEFADPLVRIALGIRAPQAMSKVTPALDLLSGILGGNDSSYLPSKFLYQDRLALAIDAEFDACSFGSVLAVSAACEPDNAAALEQGIRSQLALIRKRGVRKSELEREKLQQKLTLYQQLKISSSTVGIVNSLRMNFGNAECLEKYLEDLEKVTLDEVNAAAESYLDPRRFVWSIVHPKQTGKTSVSMSDVQDKSGVRVGKLNGIWSYTLVERNNIPLDAISVLLPAGPVWENSFHHGISQLLCKVLATGPDDMPEERFYEELDSKGIDLDISCGNNSCTVEMSFPPESRQAAETLLVRILNNPRRDLQIFDRCCQNLIKQLDSKLMEPNFAALLTARRKLYGNHAAGNSRLESIGELEAITLTEMLEFYRQRWDNRFVNFGATVAQGDLAESEKVLSGLQKIADAIEYQLQDLTVPAPATREELFRADREDITYVELPREQSTVVCAVAGGFAHTEEYYALLILDCALNGLSSNLFKEVREKRSLAYSTGVLVNCGLVQGMVALHAGVKSENALQTLDCLRMEIRRLAEHGLSEEEFASAQLASLSALARQLESAEARLLNAQLASFYGDDPSAGPDSAGKLRRITLEKCNKILNRIFTSSPLACVIAGGVGNEK